MIRKSTWSRRRFVASSGAAAGLSSRLLPALADFQPSVQQGNVIPPPMVITGGIKPLLAGSTARPMRYHAEAGDFVIHNGTEFFNRPIYGAISEFRVDAGDRPEFSLYLPGHAGNLKLGFITPLASKWAASADQVTARYRPGRMIYEIRDRALRSGSLMFELLTSATGNGLLLQIQGRDLPRGTLLAWAFGGVSGKKGRRNGDIGCEIEPVSQFFQLRAEECAGNDFALGHDSTGAPLCRLHSPFCDLLIALPAASNSHVADFTAWNHPPASSPSGGPYDASQPILAGSVLLTQQLLSMAIQQEHPQQPLAANQSLFADRSRQVAAMAQTLAVSCSDPLIDAVAPALSMVADALWDERQSCVMHGCVAWRVALAGWRGPYVLDATGAHERAKRHFRHWLGKQNIQPVTTTDPATGPADPGMRLARKENLLHSNGDLSNNHYDMNLVFFDVLLRHLRWTGDLAFAREIWPAFKRHLAWEHRLFRRTFTHGGRELPLYEAYAAIWASDNLQYSGGGTAHASAYNIFSNRAAAQLAPLLGEDPTHFQQEADLIHEAMEQLLWLPGQGAFAESKDLMGPQTVYTNPALWTVYHTVDSEVPSPRQSWQMVAERLATLKRIPVHGEGVPAGDWFLLSCSDWLPYMWSLTLIIMAENMHFALALWQAGMADEAFRLFKGNLLDSMYMGLCPGDFHMTSALDAHRQEAQRDFGDPTGISARALVEGLFGVQPDLMRNSITLRPGFPADWNRASLRHKDFDLLWHRNGPSETYEFTSRFPRTVPLTLRLPARTTNLPLVTTPNGRVAVAFDPSAVGAPSILISLPAAVTCSLTLAWHGTVPQSAPATRDYILGTPLELPPGVPPKQVDDPQKSLTLGRVSSAGPHTVFVPMQQGECVWAMPITFRGKRPTQEFAAVPILPAQARTEMLDLSAVFTHSITDMFSRSYTEPRSPLCTLSIPDTLLGGWANIGEPFKLDDIGLCGAGGVLKTPLNVGFRTPPGTSPNCVLLSWFVPDQHSLALPLIGRSSGIYLLVTGTTLPQSSRMQNAAAVVAYTDGTRGTLSMRNPETWWPIEQDYLLDDFLFVDEAPLPPRISLRTGETRLLTSDAFKGKGRTVPGGAATILYLALDPTRELASVTFEVSLYGIVGALLAATLVRPS